MRTVKRSTLWQFDTHSFCLFYSQTCDHPRKESLTAMLDLASSSCSSFSSSSSSQSCLPRRGGADLPPREQQGEQEAATSARKSGGEEQKWDLPLADVIWWGFAMCCLLTPLNPLLSAYFSNNCCCNRTGEKLEHKNPDPASIGGLGMSWQPLLSLPCFRLHFIWIMSTSDQQHRKKW